MLPGFNWDHLSKLCTTNKKLIFSIRGAPNQAGGDADAVLLAIGTSVRARIETCGLYSERKYILSSYTTYCSSRGAFGAYKPACESSLPLARIS